MRYFLFTSIIVISIYSCTKGGGSTPGSSSSAILEYQLNGVQYKDDSPYTNRVQPIIEADTDTHPYFYSVSWTQIPDANGSAAFNELIFEINTPALITTTYTMPTVEYQLYEFDGTACNEAWSQITQLMELFRELSLTAAAALAEV